MRLQELPESCQREVREYFTREDAAWQFYRHWWESSENPAARDMRRWFRCYEAFREQILHQGCDFKEAIYQWVCCSTGLVGGSMGPEMLRRRMDAPQNQFHELYWKIRGFMEALGDDKHREGSQEEFRSCHE